MQQAFSSGMEIYILESLVFYVQIPVLLNILYFAQLISYYFTIISMEE